MKKIFILTDLMFSGQHLQFENFIRSANIRDIEFTYEPEYWNLHNYDWDTYDALYCIIDQREQFIENKEFITQLHSRLEILNQNGFKFILACPWESKDNIKHSKFYKEMEKYEYTNWHGDTTWFWYWMREKHRNNKLQFSHDHNGSYWHKIHEYLYLNKATRTHRVKLYKKLNQNSNEMLEAQQLNSNIILNQDEVFFNEINTIMLSGGIKIIKIDMLANNTKIKVFILILIIFIS